MIPRSFLRHVLWLQEVFSGDVPTLHPTEQEDVCYLDFQSRDQTFTGKVHVTMTDPPLVYVRDVFGIVWRTEDTRRLNDKYKNHKSKFEHLLKYHPIGPGKSKAVAAVGDLDALLTFFNEDVAKSFIEDGELTALEVLLARAFGQELPASAFADDAPSAPSVPESSDTEEDGLLSDWSTIAFNSQDRKFKCEVRLRPAGLDNELHISLTDFLSIVGRLGTTAVVKAAYFVRTRLGTMLPCVADVPLLPLDELLAVLRLLPLSVVTQYRESGDEQRFREAVMAFAELPDLLAQEAESWTVTGRKPVHVPTERPAVPPSPRSPRMSSGSTAQAWIGKFVKLKQGVKGFGGCCGQVCSAANGYYLIKLRASGTSVKVRSADMFMVEETEEDTPDPPEEEDEDEDEDGSAAAATTSPGASSPRRRGEAGDNGSPSSFSLDDDPADAGSTEETPQTRPSSRSGRDRSSKAPPQKGDALTGPNDVEDLAPSEELGYERGRSRCGLRIKWTSPPAVSAADLVCLIAGVETRREASVVVSELKERLLVSNAVSYCTIKGFPKPILCVKSNALDVFLSILPSHYMVSNEAVARFKESHRIAWLNEQLSLGDTAMQSPIFKAAAGPMPTKMDLESSEEPDATEIDTSDVPASAGGAAAAADGEATAEQKDHAVVGAVESMVSKTEEAAAAAEAPTAAEPAVEASASGDVGAVVESLVADVSKGGAAVKRSRVDHGVDDAEEGEGGGAGEDEAAGGAAKRSRDGAAETG